MELPARDKCSEECEEQIEFIKKISIEVLQQTEKIVISKLESASSQTFPQLIQLKQRTSFLLSLFYSIKLYPLPRIE
jgi:hypothetical protein